jgi:protein-disulfide isomerase
MTHDRQLLMIGLVILALVLVGCQQTLRGPVEAAEVAQSTPVAVQPAAGPTPASIAPVETPLVLGDPNAPVTIVEFSDYQCPFCAQYTSETWPRLKAEFVDTGRVRYVFKDFPLANIHPQASKAHEAARCAGEQGTYWVMHDHLFAGQAEWAGYLDHVSVFKRYAAELELDTTAFDACLDSARWTEAVNADLAEGAGLGVRGTPNFFIDGYPLVGAQPYETFQYAIELAEQGRLGEAYQSAPQQ